MIEIGLPLVNKDAEVNEHQLAKNTLPYVVLRPLDTDSISAPEEGLMLYRLKPAPDGPPAIKIYFEYQGPVTETFTNNLTESFLASILRTSNRISQLSQLFGGQGLHEVAGNLINMVPVLGPIATGVAKAGFGMLPDLIQQSITSALKGDRFELPKMWQDSQAVLSYNVSFSLYCNNPNSDKEYKERILNPIKYLMMYVLPRSNAPNSVVYKWPYFVEADAGALFYVPEGMITDLTFEKAPIAGTLSAVANRPSMVNVRMTITSIRNTIIQNWKNNTTILPINLDTYIKTLEKKDFDNKISYKPVSSKTKVATPQQIPSKQISQTDKNIYNSLKNT